MTGETQGERIASLETRMTGHEQGCDQRQADMMDLIKEVRDDIKGWKKALWSVLGALVAWMAIQLYTLQPLREQQDRSVNVSVQQPQPHR